MIALRRRTAVLLCAMAAALTAADGMVLGLLPHWPGVAALGAGLVMEAGPVWIAWELLTNP